MSDYKSAYSDSSRHYVETVVPLSGVDKGRFDRSKERERKYNSVWKSQPVNLNEICAKFAPGEPGRKVGHPSGVKYVFKGSRYEVLADMASGYLRVRDLRSGRFVGIDGLPGGPDKTHFKILRREDM